VRALLLLVLVLPLGCGRADANRGPLQVVARVNGVEIAAPRAPNGQAIEKVIDRELLVQQALEAGLDRDPQLARTLEDTRRQLLAQAWVERRAGAAPQASREEVRAFYAQNPALFAERRIYRLRELAVSAPPEMIDVLRSELVEVGNLEEAAAWLRSRNARFSESRSVQPAEQLPLAWLPALARLQPGGIAVFAAPLGASVIELVHADEAPLSEQQAAPVIEQFLAGRKRMELAAAEVKRLRGEARIEYADEFRAR
jgi:EpsD family peptidyl-prolyl cis-trans isomerase